jgi:hypothetical protein
VHDAGQRGLGRDRRHQRRQRLTIGDVTGGDRDARAEVAEPTAKLVGVLGGRTPAADQQQMPDSVLGHQVPGDHATQTAGPAGDEHGAGLVPGRRGNRSPGPGPGPGPSPGCGCGRPRQARHEHRTLPDHDSRLVHRQRRRPHRRVEVLEAGAENLEQPEPVRDLQHRRAHQARDPGEGQSPADRGIGHDEDEAAGGVRGIARGVADDRQNPVHDVARRDREVGVAVIERHDVDDHPIPRAL